MEAVGYVAIAVHEGDRTERADKWQEKYFSGDRHLLKVKSQK